VALNVYNYATRLHCGDVDDVVGMYFTVTNLSFPFPPQFANDTNINWFQVVNSQNRQLQFSSGQWYQTYGTNVCDGGVSPFTTYPYGFDLYPATSDSPQSTNLVDCIGVNYSDNFEMYLMYRPNGGEWVPLQKINWQWSGADHTVTNGNNVTWVLTSTNNPGNPSAGNTTTHPSWNGNVGDLSWVPE
jgi:hypothetical protein